MGALSGTRRSRTGPAPQGASARLPAEGVDRLHAGKLRRDPPPTMVEWYDDDGTKHECTQAEYPERLAAWKAQRTARRPEVHQAERLTALERELAEMRL